MKRQIIAAAVALLFFVVMLTVLFVGVRNNSPETMLSCCSQNNRTCLVSQDNNDSFLVDSCNANATLCAASCNGWTIQVSLFSSLDAETVPQTNRVQTLLYQDDLESFLAPNKPPSAVAPALKPSVAPSLSSLRMPSSSPIVTSSQIPSANPSAASTSPSVAPSIAPTRTINEASVPPLPSLTAVPSKKPSAFPSTGYPSPVPTVSPSQTPSGTPTRTPTITPTRQPTRVPLPGPTDLPSNEPTPSPSPVPTAETQARPLNPTAVPSVAPTLAPTFGPTPSPSESPSFIPSAIPTRTPSKPPTGSPTVNPTALPTPSPSESPSIFPTALPSAAPTLFPSKSPSAIPTIDPTSFPTPSPSESPSLVPSSLPSSAPTLTPSKSPSASPAVNPTALPTPSPSRSPSFVPSDIPSASPTRTPSRSPSAIPSSNPTVAHTPSPSTSPSLVPSELPTQTPSEIPSMLPSALLTQYPSDSPSPAPSASPSQFPSGQPSATPTNKPTTVPTMEPTGTPSVSPTPRPTFAASDSYACELAEKDGKAVVTILTETEGELALAKSDQLCTLWQVDNSRTRLIPIGRSYAGNDWEPYSSVAMDPAKFHCGETVCSLTLPILPSGFKYELAAFDHELPRKDEVARFLEQSSFGPTRESLQAFPNSFADWIKDQQENVPMTSHREFFREHMVDRRSQLANIGITTRPCDRGSRYRQYAFVYNDEDRGVEVRTDPKTKRKTFLIDGVMRTVLEHTELYLDRENKYELGDGVYSLCDHRGDYVGSQVRLRANGCSFIYTKDGRKITNPRVYFDSDTPPNTPLLDLDGAAIKVSDEEAYLTRSIDDINCGAFPRQRFKDKIFAVGNFEGQHWFFDSQNLVRKNTLDNPLEDGGGDLVSQTLLAPDEISDDNDVYRQVGCSNPGMNFLNEFKCELSYEVDACSPVDPSEEWISLDSGSFRKIFEATQDLESPVYVYAVEGLRQGKGIVPYDPPCTPGETSRWIPSSCSGSNPGVRGETRDIFVDLLSQSDDTNPYVRDVTFPATGVSCHPDDMGAFSFQVKDKDSCWLNVHQSHLQVFDFTEWVQQHPGGREYITQFASQNEGNAFKLSFPDWHEMSRWHGWSTFYRSEIGRYGDVVRFSELPSGLHTETIAGALDAHAVLAMTGPTVVCGSPLEVASDPSTAGIQMQDAFAAAGTFDSAHNLDRHRRIIWVQIILNAKDALRQRVAWALSQILVVTRNDNSNDLTEAWMMYYDIFTRHAFGNYRDILKEVSFSPMMAEMLTYKENKSTDYLWQSRGRVEYADENYAREIMQLFSIGLHKLNIDGTFVRDEEGHRVSTYTNDEIVQYARMWTGFKFSSSRANIETTGGRNYVDPLKIEPEWRDSLPKLGLYNNGERQYIGDGYPLCSDLPERHFLKPGATYVLLGSISSPKYHSAPDFGESPAASPLMQLDETDSALYAKLCDEDSGTQRCRFPSKVVLDEELRCFGEECDIEAPQLVQVEPGIQYEYLRIPCVFQSYFVDGKAVGRLNHKEEALFSCAEQKNQVGCVACCGPEANIFVPEDLGRFIGERMSYASAEQICSTRDLSMCHTPKPDQDGVVDWNAEYWSSVPCKQRAKLSLGGQVGIVHSFHQDIMFHEAVHPSVREDTKAYFDVLWSVPDSNMDVAELFYDYELLCESLGCPRDAFDNLCLCDVELREATVFDAPPTRKGVLQNLRVGAFNPSVYWGSHAEKVVSPGVIMHSEDGKYSTESVFEVVDDNGVQRFFKNYRSDVVIGESGKRKLMFRNPPHFTSIHDKDVRDMYYETEAALDHYFYHSNTAPFLAVRFAQRFGLSNPSPRFVKVVATAFREGSYHDKSTGISFGAGRYGDMGAMIAALLLDREARSVVLDADPGHGSLSEPLLRLIRVMKSLEFVRNGREYPVLTMSLGERIGQAPYDMPDVFSFFLPEFRPRGMIGDSGRVCPECQVLSGPTAVGLMNGMLSLLKYGLTREYEGFGIRTIPENIGVNEYKPDKGLDSAGVVDELATLLTSGRLSQEKRDLLVSVYEETEEAALKYINVEQLILTTPEFHSNGVARSSGKDRQPNEPQQQSSEKYKAVLNILLSGGWDSFNVLVPSDCDGKNEAGETVDEQYLSERGHMALRSHETDLFISAKNQPCSKFAIHPSFPLAKELYDEGSLLFFANAGVIDSVQMNKYNYNSLKVTDLFAHNGMRAEAKVVDPFRLTDGEGILGRMAAAVDKKGYHTSAISIDRVSGALAGSPRKPIVVDQGGTTRFNERPASEMGFDVLDYAKQLSPTPDAYSGFFGEIWSETFIAGARDADFLDDILKEKSVHNDLKEANGEYNDQLTMVSKMMQTSDARGVDRDVIFFESGEWDHHDDMQYKMDRDLKDFNRVLTAFVKDLKEKDLWDSIVVVVTSDFGRKLATNSRNGSDHAWGGHYIVFGGGVKGGQILGQYPNDLTEKGPLNIGNGRLMPTTSWEAIWNGVSEWMGVDEDDVEGVLPNIAKSSYGDGFSKPFKECEMFKC